MTNAAPSQILSQAQAQGKNTNSIMAGWVDRGPWQYWDTVDNGAGTTPGAPGQPVPAQYQLFSVPIGAQNPLTGATKTKLETNMTRQNQFPPPRCLLLVAIGFYFSSRMLKSDIDLILDGSYMEFRIDDKIFHEGQLWEFPGGAGLWGVTTNNGESVYTNGLPSPCYQRRYDDWAKYIAPLQQFSLVINFPGTPPTMSSLGIGAYFVCPLDGLTDRSVQ
jgi:hypothetical protein